MRVEKYIKKLKSRRIIEEIIRLKNLGFILEMMKKSSDG